MRTEQIWDKWVTYDDDGFINGIMPQDLVEDVNKAKTSNLPAENK